MSRQSDWRVDVTSNIEDFAEDWRRFVTPANATPFQQYDFLRIFFARLSAGGGQPHIARVRDTNGALVALFPMHMVRKHGLNWLRTDERPLDYCTPIFDPALSIDHARDIIRAVLAAIPKADLFYVNRIPDQFAEGPSPLANMPNAARLRLSSWQIKMKGKSANELAALQAKQFKGELRSRTKKLAERFERKFEINFGVDVAPSLFSTFANLRQTSFDAKGRANIVSDPQWGPLYPILLAEGEQCQAWLASLSADDEVVATLYGFEADKRVQVILPASKMGDWQYYRLGLQLFQETLAHFHAEGAEIFDLSIGDSPYKKRMGGEEEALYDALFPGSFLGQIYYRLWRLKVALRAKMGRIE